MFYFLVQIGKRRNIKKPDVYGVASYHNSNSLTQMQMLASTSTPHMTKSDDALTSRIPYKNIRIIILISDQSENFQAVFKASVSEPLTYYKANTDFFVVTSG